MKRLEMFQKLEQLEKRKVNIENLLKDHDSYYNKETCLSCKLNTSDYNKHYNEGSIKVNSKLFKDYLQLEIQQLEIEINMYIGDLKL